MNTVNLSEKKTVDNNEYVSVSVNGHYVGLVERQESNNYWTPGPSLVYHLPDTPKQFNSLDDVRNHFERTTV